MNLETMVLSVAVVALGVAIVLLAQRQRWLNKAFAVNLEHQTRIIKLVEHFNENAVDLKSEVRELNYKLDMSEYDKMHEKNVALNAAAFEKFIYSEPSHSNTFGTSTISTAMGKIYANVVKKNNRLRSKNKKKARRGKNYE